MNDCVKHPAFSEVTMPDSTMQTGTQSTKEATMQATNPIFDFTSTFNAALAQAINQATHHLHQRIAELEVKVNNLQSTNADFIKEIADDAARMVFAEHTEEYDHDSYDRLEDKIEDKIDDYDFEDKIKDVLTNNLTLTVRVE